MDARTFFSQRLDSRTKSRLALLGAATLVALFAFVLEADAKCSARSAEPLIVARYTGCSQKAFVSYLNNDLITPYSFTCAKKIEDTCKEANCARPSTTEDAKRCLDLYVGILDGCTKQIEDAALMARCKDTKAWDVATVAARIAPSGGTAVAEGNSAATAPATATAIPVVRTPTSTIAQVSPPPTRVATPPAELIPVVVAANPSVAAIPPAPSVPSVPAPSAPARLVPRADSNDVAVIQLSPPASRISTVKTAAPANSNRTNYGPNPLEPPSRSVASPASAAGAGTSSDVRVVRKSTRSTQSSWRR